MARKKHTPKPKPNLGTGLECPCGLGEWGTCCRPFLARLTTAPTAEQLMRSRYTAFAIGSVEYLLETWHPDTRPKRLKLDDKKEWTNLVITEVVDGTAYHTTGIVAFRATYIENGDTHIQEERSQFTRVDGQWFYVEGELN